MDIAGLQQALNLSLSSDEEIRKANAEIILKAREISNFGPLLLQISADTKNTFEIQQNAAIQLKNFVKHFWKFSEENEKLNLTLKYEEDEKIIIISEQDKTYIRNHIFEAFLTNENKLIRKQYSECIKRIAKYELKNKFKFIIDKIIECFQSGIDDQIFAGIIIFYNIAKIFSFETGDLKEPYTKALYRTHDYLVNFVPGLLENFQNEKACLIIYYIIKTYFLSSTLTLDPIILKAENAEKWLCILIAILEKKYSGDLIKKTEKPEEIKILSENVYWKIKSYCMKIFNNFYSKYSFTGRVQNDARSEFSNIIKNKYAEKFFNVYLKILYDSKEEFIPDLLGGYVFRFFSELLSNNHLVNKIEEYLDTILKEFLIQSVFLKMEEIELWKNDVKSYLLKNFNFLEGFKTRRNNAMKFANELCKHKRKNPVNKKEKIPVYFDTVYKFFVNVLEIYDDQIKNNMPTDFRIKEAVLFIVENVCNCISENSPETIEKFVELFVIKELEASNPFIRLRAFMVIYSFKSLKYTKIENIMQVTDSIFKSLGDENLSVRVFAAICAPTFFGHKDIKGKLDQHIPHILRIYINLMNEIDLEEILISLEYIVQIFNEKIKDFVVDLTKILVDRFNKMCKVEDDNFNSNTPIVKEGIIKTLISIIGIFAKHQGLFDLIYKEIREIIQYGFLDDGMENYEDSLDLILSICKEGDCIYPGVWEFYIPILESILGTEEDIEKSKNENPNAVFIGYGQEHFEQIINNILLFITRDIDVFLNGNPNDNAYYVKKSIQLVHNTIHYSIAYNDYTNIRSAFKILTAIIESAKGKIDILFAQIVMFFMSQLQRGELKKDFKNALNELCSSCFIYNPQLMINIISENNALEKVLEFWLNKTNSSQFEVQKNKILLAIISLITLNPQHQDPIITKNIKFLIDTLIGLVKEKYDDFEDNMEEASEKTNFELEDGENHKNNEVNEDKDIEDILNDDLEENEEESEWDQLEFLNEMTIVEKINPIIYLKDGFAFIQNNFPDYYQNLLSFFSKEELKILRECIRKAEIAANKKDNK